MKHPIDPQNAKAYLGRAWAWAGKGEYDKAFADCNEAIRLDPQYAEGYIGRGLYWDEKGEYDKAIAGYTEAIRLDRQDCKAYYNRGPLGSQKASTTRPSPTIPKRSGSPRHMPRSSVTRYRVNKST